jgi:type IV pilus assembly protein PilX
MNKISKSQSGAVLVIGLFIVLILSVIGVSATQSSEVQEKMAGNIRNRNLAFQAAESALVAGETYLSKTSTPTFNCTNGLYKPRDVNCDGTLESVEVWDNSSVWSTDGKSVKYDTDGVSTTIDLAGLAASPRYIIEEVDTVCATSVTPCPVADQKKTYRVTARAIGNSTDAVVMLQSVFSPT